MNHHKPHPMTGAAIGSMRPQMMPADFDRPEHGFAQQALTQVESQPPQLSRTSERLHHCIAELGGLVAKLESALDPVLNPDMTNKAGGVDAVAAPEPIRCPLGRSMDARSDEVCEISARVRSLLDRLAC